MGDKLYVVLDIDDTLLKNIKDEFKDKVPNLDKFETAVNVPGKTLVLRPHVREFMDYLFKNHYVSIWTWSDHAYAMRVANVMTNGHPEMFKDILSEEDADISSTLHKVRGKDLNYLWYHYSKYLLKTNDVPYTYEDRDSEEKKEQMRQKEAKRIEKNKKIIEARKKVDERIAERNANIVKMNADRVEEGLTEYNSAPKVPFTGYAPCNTILIDDADYNVNSSNEFNLIQIKPFGGHTTTHKTAGKVPEFDDKDEEFPKIIKYLEELRAKKACEKDEDLGEELHVMKAGRRTRRHKRMFKKTRKLKRKLRKGRRS